MSDYDCKNCGGVRAIIEIDEKVDGRVFDGKIHTYGKHIAYSLNCDAHLDSISKEVSQDPLKAYERIHLAVIDSTGKQVQVPEHAEKIIFDFTVPLAVLMHYNPILKVLHRASKEMQKENGLEMKLGNQICLPKHPHLMQLISKYDAGDQNGK